MVFWWFQGGQKHSLNPFMHNDCKMAKHTLKILRCSRHIYYLTCISRKTKDLAVSYLFHFSILQSTGRHWNMEDNLQKQPLVVFYEDVLQNFSNPQENTCASVFFNKVDKRLRHRSFSVKFAKFLGTPYRTPTGECFCTSDYREILLQ